MKIINILVLIIAQLFISSCVDNSEKIKLHLSQNIQTSTDERLSFTLSIITDSEVELSFSINEDIHEMVNMNTMKNLNLCKHTPFYMGDRKSNVVEINISKTNPYISNISADYNFDESNNLHIYDFGELGKICTNQRNKKFILAFTFYEANYSTKMTFKSEGVTSNRVDVQTVGF